MNLDFVRHAESQGNASRILQGQLDSPLSQNGVLQAESLRERLNHPYDLYFSSSLIRAKQTAYLALNLTKQEYSKIICLDEMMEMNFGILQGLNMNKFTEEQKLMWKNLKTIPTYNNHRGETGIQFLERVMKGLKKIIKMGEEKNAKKILIFTHGGVLKVIHHKYFPNEINTYENTVIFSFTLNEGNWKINK